MLTIEDLFIEGYEQVIEAKDPSVGLHCFIAIHNTALGPSLGGVRFYPYTSDEEALLDVLRLAKAMTYKSSIAHTGLGGGKAVIIGDPAKLKTPEFLERFGEVVNSLGGRYIAAEDVGTNLYDMVHIHKGTRYVAALPTSSSSGDPSPFTAHGVLVGIRAVASTLWGSTELKGKRIAVQGLGNVGGKLAQNLFWEGADLIVADINKERTEYFNRVYEAEVVSPEEIHQVSCDIFAPCALAGILNPFSIPDLRCLAVAGGANNQLSDPVMGELLQRRQILYAPDYVINAGGILNAASEFDPTGYHSKAARAKVDHLFAVLIEIFEESNRRNLPTNYIADAIAERNLEQRIGVRQTPLVWH